MSPSPWCFFKIACATTCCGAPAIITLLLKSDSWVLRDVTQTSVDGAVVLCQVGAPGQSDKGGIRPLCTSCAVGWAEKSREAVQFSIPSSFILILCGLLLYRYFPCAFMEQDILTLFLTVVAYCLLCIHKQNILKMNHSMLLTPH